METKRTWVEKYRPTDFTKIVLTDYNKQFFSQMIEKNIFPNLLFYGPPGSGKTTTIINIIKLYQQHYNQEDPSLIMHLNASDDRGIDTIRLNIMNFVNSQTLFTKGLKFIVLDEVDYMTKNAQLALKQLISVSNCRECRFCLICNYISKLDISLQSEFITIRFNDLPKKDVIDYLKYINKNENLDFTNDDLINIQQLYRSDMRSMINYIQNYSNTNNTNNTNKIYFINEQFLHELYMKNLNLSLKEFMIYIKAYQHLDEKNILKQYINYIIDLYINSDNINTNTKFIDELKIIYFNINSNSGYYWYYIYYLVSNFYEQEQQ